MFICFEGLAGSGKTTQANKLSDYLKSVESKDVLVSAVYEGERRRLVSDFMNISGIKLDQNAIMFLFQALHAAQYHEVKKALSLNMVVIADRWRYSFFAHHLYQNTFGGDKDILQELDLLAYRSLEPDICFLIDVSPDVAHERYMEREQSIVNNNGLELMNLEYFFSISNYYKNLAQTKKWCVVDGRGNEEEIFQSIKTIIDLKI